MPASMDMLKFVKIEKALLDYLSDQWPSAYGELVRLSTGEEPDQRPGRGYEWLACDLLDHLKENCPSAFMAMMSRATLEPAEILRNM